MHALLPMHDTCSGEAVGRFSGLHAAFPVERENEWIEARYSLFSSGSRAKWQGAYMLFHVSTFSPASLVDASLAIGEEVLSRLQAYNERMEELERRVNDFVCGAGELATMWDEIERRLG